MIINHPISTVLLLVFLSACVGATKHQDPKSIPLRKSGDLYKSQRIARDGNCFYRSLSLYLYDSQEHFNNIRQQILNFMSDREDQYQHLIERNVNYRDYARYISDHRRDHEWAEHPIVQAAADLLGIDIYVTHYSETSGPLQVTRARSEQFHASGQISQRWLHLQLHVQDSHYEIINDYTEEGVSEPSCEVDVSDLLSIHIQHVQDPAEIETLDFRVVKIKEEEEDFEDQHQKKRIRNSIYQLELKRLTESNRIGNERDLASGSGRVENLGTQLENLHIELEGEACSDIPVNEVWRSDSEESFENQTDIPLEKKTHDGVKIHNIDHLRKMIRNGQVRYLSHFRVRRLLGYFHHFLTLETNAQSMTVLHLTISCTLKTFCEQALVNFSNFDHTFFDFNQGVELLSWYAIPTNRTTLHEINLRIQEVLASDNIHYSPTSPNKMDCGSLISYIFTGEKDYREVREFVRQNEVFGILLVLIVNWFCLLIFCVRYLSPSKSKLKNIIHQGKSSIADKFNSFLRCLFYIWNSVAFFINKHR